jgi:hypothetical protein
MALASDPGLALARMLDDPSRIETRSHRVSQAALDGSAARRARLS